VGVKAIVCWPGHRWVCLVADSGSKVCLVNGRLLIALRCLLLMLVSMPFHTVNHCCSGFPVSGGI